MWRLSLFRKYYMYTYYTYCTLSLCFFFPFFSRLLCTGSIYDSSLSRTIPACRGASSRSTSSADSGLEPSSLMGVSSKPASSATAAVRLSSICPDRAYPCRRSAKRLVLFRRRIFPTSSGKWKEHLRAHGERIPLRMKMNRLIFHSDIPYLYVLR